MLCDGNGSIMCGSGAVLLSGFVGMGSVSDRYYSCFLGDG